MKNLLLLSGFVFLALMLSGCEKDLSTDPACKTVLKSGNTGNEKITGFDEWGFNWNAHEFRGYTINMLLGDHAFIGMPHYKKYVYHGEGMDFWDMLVSEFEYFPWLMPAELLDSRLISTWNDALISSNGEYPANGWMDTGAWIVFDYSGRAGNESWKAMRKLVAARSTDQLTDGVWYNDAGEEIGLESMFWSDLIIVQVVNNGDVPPFPFFFEDYNSPNGPGYGQHK
jgi:hypothetical protein